MDGIQDAPESGQSAPVAFGSGRGGPVRAALSRALQEARSEGRLTAEHEVRVVLAKRFADVVDRASRDSDARALLTAGEKLLELLDTLPVRAPGGGSAGDGNGERARVLELLDSPPQVGH